MTEPETAPAVSRQTGQSVEFRVAAELDNLAVVRMLISALGTFQDLDLDAVADLRLAIDEACTRLIRAAVPSATLSVVVDPDDARLRVSASTSVADGDVLGPGSFSWHVISSLTDDLDVFSSDAEGGRIFGITMTARRVGLSA